MKNKKVVLLLAAIISVFSCKENIGTDKPAQKQVVEILETQKFSSIGHKNEAILLADTIKIYDKNQNVLSEIAGVFGELVKIDSISENKFDLKNSNDRCQLHHFVRIKSNKVSGWTYGQFVFEKENKKRDKTLVVDGVTFQIVPTKNFGIGVYDEELDGLSFCGEGSQNPVLFFNGLYNKFEYLPIQPPNENYYENYLTLDSNDGWDDEIKKYSLKGKILILEIRREYQEGHVTIAVEIDLNEQQSTCKVIKVEKFEN